MEDGKIIVKIDKLGRPTVIGQGFVGQSCDEKMKPIEDAFKGGRMIRENSPEYYQEEQTNEQELML